MCFEMQRGSCLSITLNYTFNNPDSTVKNFQAPKSVASLNVYRCISFNQQVGKLKKLSPWNFYPLHREISKSIHGAHTCRYKHDWDKNYPLWDTDGAKSHKLSFTLSNHQYQSHLYPWSSATTDKHVMGLQCMSMYRHCNIEPDVFDEQSSDLLCSELSLQMN